MKRSQSDLLQTVSALWLATLFCILVLHYVAPKDPWVTKLTRPIFLVIAPIVVACIPVLAAKSISKRRGADEGGDLYEDRSRMFGGIQASTVWKMALVWLVSLVIFASPHGGTPMGAFDFVWHNLAFLIVAPLLLACIPLPAVSSKLRRSGISFRQVADDSPYLLWKGLISCTILAVVLILCLIGVNSMKGAVGNVSVNIAISVLLVGDLAAFWNGVKRLRKRRD